jgi:integrase
MPKVADKVPFTLSLDQKDAILVWTYNHTPKMLGLATLEIILGVRPFETLRLNADCIKLEERKVMIDAAASKVWKRRIVPITDEAFIWLKIAEHSGAKYPVSHSTRRRFIKKLRTMLGFKAWPQDSLRHTAATNMLRKSGDAGKVARWLGNSEKILLKNYADI